MREWNVPELKVLTIEKTKNGIFNSKYETVIILNDSKKPVYPNSGNTNTDNNNSDGFDQLS